MIQTEQSGDWTTDKIVIVILLDAELMKVEDVEDWRLTSGVTESGY